MEFSKVTYVVCEFTSFSSEKSESSNFVVYID